MAPLEKAISSPHSELSSQTSGDAARDRDGSSSRDGENRSIRDASSSGSTTISNASGNTGSSSNTSSSSTDSSTRGAVDGHSGDDTTFTVNPSAAQNNHIETEGTTANGDANTQAHAPNVRTDPSDAASAVETNGKVHGGTSTGKQSDASANSAPSRAIRRRLSDASVASVASSGGGRDRRTLRGVSLNTTNPHVSSRPGQLFRTGSTRLITTGNRVEVRGELELMNVSSAEEIIRLLEDTTSPLALQLQNVELRVGPSQSVRLGEAVPALREHLRRDLERQLQQEGGVGREERSGVLTEERRSALRSGTSVSSSSRGSSILLTGTVMGGVNPRLLGSRSTSGTAKAPAPPKAQVFPRKGAAAAGEPVTSRTLQALSTGVASDTAVAPSSDAAIAVPTAAVSAPRSAAVAEQAQQERASAEAASLVQQVLEIQGQVKSLLAEEGLSSVSAETAALKKKKGALDGPEDANQQVRGREGNTRSDADGDTRNGKDEGAGGDSIRVAVSPSSSGSSSSRTIPKALAASNAALLPQQAMTGAAIARNTLAGSEAQRDVSTSSQRLGGAHLAAAGASRVEGKEQDTASEEPWSIEDAGGGKTKESVEVKQAEKPDTGGHSGKRESHELEEPREKERPGAHQAETKKQQSVTERAAEDISLTAHPEHTGIDRKGQDESTTEEKPSIEKGRASQSAREVTQTATAATGMEHGTTREDGAPRVQTEEEEGDREKGRSLGSKDNVKPSDSERNVSGTTATKAAESKFPGREQTAGQRQTKGPNEEQPRKQPDDSLPQLEPSQKPEIDPSTEMVRNGAEDQQSGQKRISPKAEEAEEIPSRGGLGETSATDRKATEHSEGGRAEKSGVRESGTSAEAPSAAAASPAPTFVQALSNFFSWGEAEEEIKPHPVSGNEVEAGKTSNRGDEETEEDRIEKPTEPGEQVHPTTPAADSETGTGIPEEQTKKKQRPKLQPKAPPARVALSKRDKMQT